MQAETDSHSPPPPKHNHGIQSTMPKPSGTAAVMSSALYPVTRDTSDRGMRHASGTKDGNSSQMAAFQNAQRQPKAVAGLRGNNFHLPSSWEWTNAPQQGARQVVSSSADVNGLSDPSGLVMEMQTAFEEGNGLNPSLSSIDILSE